MVTNSQCSDVYELYKNHPFDKPIINTHAKKWRKTDVHHGLSKKTGVQNIHTKFYKINEDKVDPTLLPILTFINLFIKIIINVEMH